MISGILVLYLNFKKKKPTASTVFHELEQKHNLLENFFKDLILYKKIAIELTSQNPEQISNIGKFSHTININTIQYNIK